MTIYSLLFTSFLALSPIGSGRATAAQMPFAESPRAGADSFRQGSVPLETVMREEPANAIEPVEEPHQGAVFWRQGNWTVMVDEEDCSLDLSFVEEGREESFSSMGVTLHFGDTGARVAFAHSKFTQILQDREYPISIVFLRGDTADTRWGTQTFTGFEDFQANALFADLAWDDLHRDLITATSVAIFLNGELLHRYSLEGAETAVSQLERCLSSDAATTSEPGVTTQI